MPEPITYGERFFSADGTEINIFAAQAGFHDATLADRTQGGFDGVTILIGRFVGLVNASAVDADNVRVDFEEFGSDGSESLRFVLSAEVGRRIAAVTLNYSPENSPFEFFNVVFWNPYAATEVVSETAVTYLNPGVIYPWVTKEPVGNTTFNVDTFYGLTVDGPAQGVAGDLTFTAVVDHFDGNLPGHQPENPPFTPRAVLENFHVFMRQADGTVIDVRSPQAVPMEFFGGPTPTFPLPTGWVGVTFDDHSYYKNYGFYLGTVAETTPTDPGTGGSGSGIVLAGSVDPHAGWGAGELRGFQSGPQQIISAAGSAQSPLSQWIVRESGRSYTTAGATAGTGDTGSTDPGTGSSS